MTFKIGDLIRIKIEHVNQHGDWKEHENQIGEIVSVSSGTYCYRIKWKDGRHSATGDEYIEGVSWKERLQ